MLNRLELIGNCGGNPEVKYTKSGTAVVSFSLATTDKWKSKTGEKMEKTEWHTLVFWDKLAEIVGEYVRKGDKLYVSGKLIYEKWESKEGTKMTTAKLQVKDMEMLGSPRGKEGHNEEEEVEGPGARARRLAKESGPDEPGDASEDLESEQVPY